MLLIWVKAFIKSERRSVLEDFEIVELYLKRDENAIKHTTEKYGKRLRALSFNITSDKQTAEECENDTYLEAWSLIPPNEPKTYLYAFLARIIRHISINRCRESNRQKRKAFICELDAEMEQCIPTSRYECSVDDFLLGDAINAFLSTLDREKRNVFLRRYWFLDSVSDISKRFSISKSKVKTMLFRCRNALREYLEKEGYNI